MSERLDNVAVLGAGVMGTAIAAHFAGAGARTHLLDIVPPELRDSKDREARNKLAKTALEKSLKAKPAPYYDPDAARLIVPGNLEDDLDRLSSCDLVIEAVVENLDIKRSVLKKIAPKLGPNTLLASNTSGLSITAMAEALPPEIAERFVVMHFFNPPRYMRLLEIVPGPKTSKASVERALAMCEFLGKSPVLGKDTPSFVSNRIGSYALLVGIHAMMREGYTAEELDEISGAPMARPGTGTFRLLDLVGVDIFVHAAKYIRDNVPTEAERAVFDVPSYIVKMAERGQLGKKTGFGFYKKEGDTNLIFDPEREEFRAVKPATFDSIKATKHISNPRERLKAFVAADDRAGRFGWKMLAKTLVHAAERVGEIADDIVQIDRSVRWGFGWELGPFEAWDAIGVQASLDRLAKDGFTVPESVTAMLKSGRTSFYEGPASARTFFDLGARRSLPVRRDPRELELAVLREDKAKIIRENAGASLLDAGDGCLLLEVHTKMNAIDEDVVRMIRAGVEEAEKNFAALLVGNEGAAFGTGMSLAPIHAAAEAKQWDRIDETVKSYQQAMQAIRFAKVPVVAAAFSTTLAESAELVFAAAQTQAHAETYIGLTHGAAGLIPASGGCLRIAQRWAQALGWLENMDPWPFLQQAFMNIASARTSTSAEDARRIRYIRPSDGISFSREHLLYHARERALGLARSDYRPPRPVVLKAAGNAVAATIGMRAWGMAEGSYASKHDALIAKKLVHVLCGGDCAPGAERTEQQYLDLEREAFVSLCGEEKTRARMHSLITANKPLRN